MAVTKVEITSEAERLAARPYHIVIHYDSESGDYVARIPELRGLVTGGKTFEKARALAEDAKRGWIATALYYGDPIPDPESESGAVVVDGDAVRQSMDSQRTT